MAETNAHVTDRSKIQNPYSRENRGTYNMGSFEKFFHDLGFRTGYDNYQMDMDNAAGAWETQNQSLGYEEQYNSEAAQAARMRAAGLNPDLQGLGDAAKASEMAEPEGIPTTGVNELSIGGNAAAKLGTFLLDTLMGSTGLLKTLGDTSINIGKYLFERDKTEIGNNQDMYKLVQEAHEKYGNLGDENDLTFANGAYIAKAMGLSKRQFGKFSKMYDDLYNSVPTLTKRLNDQSEEYEAETKASLLGDIRTIQELTTAAAVANAQTENLKAQKLAEAVAKNPEFTEEEFKAGHAKTLDEAKAAKFEAAYKEYNAEVAKLDKEQAQRDQKIINDWLEGQTKKNPKTYMKYRNALRRRMGVDDIIGDFIEDATKVGLGVAGGAAAAKIAGKAAGAAKNIPNARKENTPRYDDWEILHENGVDTWDYYNPKK